MSYIACQSVSYSPSRPVSQLVDCSGDASEYLLAAIIISVVSSSGSSAAMLRFSGHSSSKTHHAWTVMRVLRDNSVS